MPKNKFLKLHPKSPASKKAPTTQPSAAESTALSWKPTEGCVYPDGCINGSPIDPEKPGDSIPLLCSNDEKCTVKSLFLHPECMEKWEEGLWPFCHKGCGTGRLGDAGAWFNKHRPTVLWSKSQGYGRIRRFCKCPCGGFLKRDLNALKHEEDGQAKPCKKKSKAPSAALPEMNKEGLVGQRGTLRNFNFVRQQKQKCGETKPQPVHFWEESASSKPKKAIIVGQTKPASPIPQPRPRPDKAENPEPLHVKDPQAHNTEMDQSELNDVGVFFECLKEVLRRNGGSVEKEGEVMESFLDRVSPPLTSQIFSLNATPVEWILIFGAPDIFLDGHRIALSGALVKNGLSLEDGEGEEWATVVGGGRRKGASESSSTHPPPSFSNSVGSGRSLGDRCSLSVYERDLTGMRTDEYAVGHEDLIFLFNLMGFKFDILRPDKEPEEE